MKEDELVSSLKELIRCYEYMTSPDSPTCLEIDMWRKRFIQSQNLSPVHARYLCYVPSENLMKTTPEDYIKSLGDI